MQGKDLPKKILKKFWARVGVKAGLGACAADFQLEKNLHLNVGKGKPGRGVRIGKGWKSGGAAVILRPENRNKFHF